MMTVIYAGSFDPPTFGHAAVAAEAMRIFGRVCVAVGTNSSKKPTFSPEQRMEMMAETMEEYKGGIHLPPSVLEVEQFSGLLVEYAEKKGSSHIGAATGGKAVIVRGLRAVSDFESEMMMAAANHRMNSRISTVFIPTLPDVAHVSSSMVKEIARHTRDPGKLSQFVSQRTAEALITALGSARGAGEGGA